MTSRLPYNAARGSDPDLANRRTANGSSQELYGVQPNFQQGLSSVQQQQQQQRGRHYSTDSSMSGSQESLAIEMNPYQQQQALFAASGAAAQQQAQQQAQAQQQHMLQHPHRNMPSMMMDPFYQQAPQSGVTMTRKKIVKRLELFRGYLISGGEWAMMANLVLNAPIPDRLLANVSRTEGEEFTAMRYSAVTCDPNQFVHENYTLRTALYGRPTELMIVMTMYNEDDDLFARSMTSVAKNIAYLCSRKRSTMWGPEGWKKIVVVIVADGRSKVHPRVLEALGIMGVYQDDIAKSTVGEKPVVAHLFEYTSQVCIDTDMRVRGEKQNLVPMQVVFCLKEQNKKKINSHRWAFNAFAPILNPNICILLDVGTKPTTNSLYHLWKAFDLNANVGGACGEIAVDTGKGCAKLGNPIVAAQNFEYKMSNVLDKPLESVFGYISVLPGAFSAYRYAALLDTSPGVGPLSSYFYGEKMHSGTSNIFKANMYLAEDRILCFELLAKRNASWTLKYVKAAIAITDVPEGVPELISQRRRWLNGSLFAAFYSIIHWHRLWNTDHSLFQKLLFQVQFLYNLVNIFFTWFSLANFYLIFFYLTQIFATPDSLLGTAGPWIFEVFRQLYIFAIVIIFIVSLGNRPQGSKWIYVFCGVLFIIIMIQMLLLTGLTMYATVQEAMDDIPKGASVDNVLSYAFVNNANFRNLIVSTVATYGLYILASLLYADPWHMLTSFVQYMLLLPCSYNILMVYAFCNTHDISWGTKGDNKASDLGGVKIVKDGKTEVVDVELPFQDLKDKTALNEDYNRWLASLPNRPAFVEPKRDAKTKMEDWYRSFRTHLVLFWMFSNALTIVVLTYPALAPYIAGENNYYLMVMFFSILGLSVIRFIGSFIYLLGYWRDTYASCRCC